MSRGSIGSLIETQAKARSTRALSRWLAYIDLHNMFILTLDEPKGLSVIAYAGGPRFESWSVPSASVAQW